VDLRWCAPGPVESFASARCAGISALFRADRRWDLRRRTGEQDSAAGPSTSSRWSRRAPRRQQSYTLTSISGFLTPRWGDHGRVDEDLTSMARGGLGKLRRQTDLTVASSIHHGSHAVRRQPGRLSRQRSAASAPRNGSGWSGVSIFSPSSRPKTFRAETNFMALNEMDLMKKNAAHYATRIKDDSLALCIATHLE
jgi:hypothetical protein